MINKDENSRPQKCTSSLLSGNDSEVPVIFMNMLIACCIGVEIVNNFFQFQQISKSQTDPLCEEEENSISIRLAWIIFSNLFYYSAYFCYYS